jgi:ABC-type dipeptide/oligopeptide/nickel transport system permease component
MVAYTLRRVTLLVPLLFGIVVVVFGLLQIIPGDPAVVLLGQDGTPEAVSELRATLGLDRPLPIQLGRYILNLTRGDLGVSIFRGETVVAAIASRLPATIEVAVAALIFAILLGSVLGVLSAIKQGSAIDTASMLFAQLGVSMPVFWLGILLMLWFAVTLNWLPAVGRGEPLLYAAGTALTGNPGPLIDSLRHIALPALVLGLNSAAVLSRVIRASMLETLNKAYVRTAKAKGLHPWKVVLLHALRNALLPVVNIIGLRFGALLGGAVLTESIFGWPGLGQLAVTAISQRDFPLVQGVILIFALMFALVNLTVDLINAALDPRVRAADTA